MFQKIARAPEFGSSCRLLLHMKRSPARSVTTI